jgi:membrane-associated protease RseP (regulator of RpoE activity)
MNLLPIGQLDGGHIVNACLPKHAKTISLFGIGILFLGVFVWAGWLVWALALILMRAYVSLPIPAHTPLSRRAISIMVLTIVAFGCCFMPRPVMVENMSFEDVIWLDEFGEETQLPEEFVR